MRLTIVPSHTTDREVNQVGLEPGTEALLRHRRTML
jgi:hypothetical protein